MVGEMLCLPNAKITIPLNYKQDEIMDMCITKRCKCAEGGLEGCATQGQVRNMHAYTATSNLAKREHNNLPYKEANASCDNGRRREAD
jgi:hypothetical protein